MNDIQQKAKPPRIQSVDFLRGLVIVIMALDHVRDYVTNVRFDPLDLDETNASLFLTRWITHFCAPVFVFLAGTSAGFQRHAGKTGGELSMFLFTRGLWLVFLEFTAVKLAWLFNFPPALYIMQVIWVIGVSMIILAVLVRLPMSAVIAVGLVTVVGHNALDAFGAASFAPSQAMASGQGQSTALGNLWSVLHIPGQIQAGSITFLIGYPLIPWFGVMALGYAFADLYKKPENVRRSLILKIGIGMIAAFVLLRGINIYGDPSRWAVQGDAVKTFLSFINTTKYPPSLLYLLMTLGPTLVVLSFAERWKGALFSAMVTFGRVPLFFYIIHLYVAHLAAVFIGMAQGYKADSFFSLFIFFPPDYGVGLFGVYIVWIAVVALLYPPSKWFAGVKKRNKSPWLSYF